MNFADHPRTLGEVRSDRSDDAKDWSPRDVLISVLRRIDSGDLDVEHMIVVWARPKDYEGNRMGVVRSGDDAFLAHGLLNAAASSVLD